MKKLLCNDDERKLTTRMLSLPVLVLLLPLLPPESQ